MNNDYVAGHVMRGRHEDYQREVDRDRRASEFRCGQAEWAALRLLVDRAVVPPAAHHWWRSVIAHLSPPHRPVHGHRS